MKKKIIIVWSIFVICLIATISLWFLMNDANPEYEEVKAIVTSAKTEETVNKKTGSRTTFYKIEVRYDGKTYDLENAHNT
ncbi:MAG: penicillin-binding protein, partial [Clostridia bacterium]|nr:penicillin-binding protein [Clostridia bacterium]